MQKLEKIPGGADTVPSFLSPRIQPWFILRVPIPPPLNHFCRRPCEKLSDFFAVVTQVGADSFCYRTLRGPLLRGFELKLKASLLIAPHPFVQIPNAHDTSVVEYSEWATHAVNLDHGVIHGQVPSRRSTNLTLTVGGARDDKLARPSAEVFKGELRVYHGAGRNIRWSVAVLEKTVTSLGSVFIDHLIHLGLGFRT